MNKRELDLFMRDIELLIPLKDTNAKRFLKDMRNSISDFVDANVEADRETIICEFGDPKHIAMDYIESLDADDLLKRISVTKILRRIAGVMIVAVIIALSLLTYFQYRGYIDTKKAIVQKEQTVIIYGDEP